MNFLILKKTLKNSYCQDKLIRPPAGKQVIRSQMFKTKIGKCNLEVQIENLATQASGSCLMKLGETTILAACQQQEEKPGLGFFPLTCNYEERYYAAGKILGSRFMRREGRPSNEAVLISRLVDRIIRPLFPKGFKREVQVIPTCLSWDEESDPAVLAILASSLALSISDIPWQGPVAAVRVGKINENFILNPNYQEREKGELDLVVSGVEKNNEILINMIELQGDEVLEKVVIKAIDFAKPELKKLIDFQKKIAQKAGKEKIPFTHPLPDPELEKEVKRNLEKRLEKALYQKEKQERQLELENLKEEILERIKAEFEEEKIGLAMDIFEREKEKVFKKNILKEEKRPDGRKLDQIREIKTKIAVLPRIHGSGLFSRGETRALSILTLGAPGDHQLLDGMEVSGKKRFFHHYNFPPYSVGEVRPLRGPARREIGHGILAEKALLPLIPKFEDFPYTIRIVSEMLSSNGSTSMASVSSACLALMDGGVPITRPAAGIAIGLITGQEQPPYTPYKLLTDIQGPEDANGDMDFKVAGTEKGLTVLQMDVKIKGITKEILEESLLRAKKARLEILKLQNKTISRPNKQLSSFAPRVYIIQINPQKIGNVIGTGGKVINEITEQCEVTIDIEESGKIFVTAENHSAGQKAIDWIKNLTEEAEIGEIFQGKVKRILNFGAMVEILPNQEGLVHISEFTDFRIENIKDVVKVGDIIPVKVVSIDEQGRINLSAKQAGFKPKKE